MYVCLISVCDLAGAQENHQFLLIKLCIVDFMQYNRSSHDPLQLVEKVLNHQVTGISLQQINAASLSIIQKIKTIEWQ